jgi:hypothetical protein
MGNRSPPDVKNRYQMIRHRASPGRRAATTDRQNDKEPPSQNQTDFSIRGILA